MPGRSCAGRSSSRVAELPIQDGNRFEVERRAYRAPDGIAINDAVGLHPIDTGNGFGDVHTSKKDSASRSQAVPPGSVLFTAVNLAGGRCRVNLSLGFELVLGLGLGGR